MKFESTFDDVLAIIPARKVSKRLPGKNRMKLSGGLELWENTVQIARNAGIEKIVVSTDDNEILDKLYPQKRGIIFGLKRSPDTATDDAATRDVILEVMQQLSHYGLRYDTICILQPTSPLLEPYTLKHALHQYYSHKYPCLVAVNKNYEPCGAFHILNKDSLIQDTSLYVPGLAVYMVDEKEAIDIDHIWTFRIAEAVLREWVI